MADIQTQSLTLNRGDNLWDRLKENVDGLAYSEADLRGNRELFVYIAQFNDINNFRNIVPPRTLTVPKKASLADVVITVRTDTTKYEAKWYEWVDMDRCADGS